METSWHRCGQDSTAKRLNGKRKLFCDDRLMTDRSKLGWESSHLVWSYLSIFHWGGFQKLFPSAPLIYSEQFALPTNSTILMLKLTLLKFEWLPCCPGGLWGAWEGTGVMCEESGPPAFMPWSCVSAGTRGRISAMLFHKHKHARFAMR